MPATGAQARSLGPPPRVPPATTTAVTRPGASADEIPCPAGMSSKRSKTDGSTVTGTSMSTVPDTVGVITRRNSDSRAANSSCTIADATMSVASRAGPPSTSASTLTAMTALVGPTERM